MSARAARGADGPPRADRPPLRGLSGGIAQVSPRAPHRVLVMAQGELGERLAGPEIRALELAKGLSARYEVTLAAQRADESEREGIRVVPSTRRRLLREAARHDAVLSACLPPYLLALAPLCELVAIADQYDPHEHELATLADSRERERELRARAAVQALQLRHADIVLCASARQRAELIRTASALLNPAGRPSAPRGRPSNPGDRPLDPGDRPLAPGSRPLNPGDRPLDPVVLPFGIPDPPPPSSRRPLRERFPQIADTDTLVLWWGSVWRWLDAETPIRAFARIAAARSDVKLVITAGRPPSKSAERMFDAAEEMRALAGELGVLGRSVLFLDEWIPYERRYDYLREANIGLTLHRHAGEAQLAARARYMDYLGAELPCVLGRGDETAEELGAAGFATLLEDPTPEALAAALLALADDPGALAAARAAGHLLASERHWSAVGAKLCATLASAFVPGALSPRPASPRTSLRLLGGAGAYYTRRALDRLSAAA